MKKIILLILVLICALPKSSRAASGCTYPTSLDSFVSVIAGDFLTIALLNKIMCAVESTQSELGVIPSAAYSTVSARLDDLIVKVGVSGGQTLKGGTAAADGLTLQATAGSGAGSEFIKFLGGNNGATEWARLTPTGLGVGIAAPGWRLHLGADTDSGAMIDSAATTPLAFVTGRSSRGTIASPTTTQSGDNLFRVSGRGYVTGTGYLGNSGSIDFVATETPTASATGGQIDFYTVLNGTTTSVFRGRWTNDGALQIPELGTVPACPGSSTGVNMYHKSDRIIFEFNDGGTCRYKSMLLSGTGSGWDHATTSP